MASREPLDRDFLDAVPTSRRDFLKKMAAVGFAVPVIGTFTMDSVALAGGNKRRRRGPRHKFPNMTRPNQCFPNQHHSNMTRPKQRRR
jgi:hypothetical protein